MKKLFIIVCMFIMQQVYADTAPYYINSIPKTAIGVFQTGEQLTIYEEPNTDSRIVKTFDFSYNPQTMPDDVFALLINERKLGMLYVSDIGDEDWVEVIYDKKQGLKGWVQTEDRLQFLPWISFYNLYARKYGLRIFKDAPDEVNILHSRPEDLSQNIGKMNYVKQIKLTAVRGNWALISAYDLDKIPKTGYIKWRSIDGTIYAFPNIK